MKAIERIEQRWITDKDLQDLSVDQARCVIDALALAVFADLESDSDEAVAFESTSMSLPFGWGEIEELGAYADTVSRLVAKLTTEADILARVQEVASAIPEQVREQVFGMIVAIAVADRELHDSEAALLTAFAGAFAFDEDTARGIYDDIVDAMGLEEA